MHGHDPVGGYTGSKEGRAKTSKVKHEEEGVGADIGDKPTFLWCLAHNWEIQCMERDYFDGFLY
jgi:hypothetical protein